jgi:hypothetical protein
VRLTKRDIEELEAKGLIRGFVDPGPPKKVTTSEGEQVSLKRDKGSKTKGWIELQLIHWCRGNGLELRREFRFDHRKGGRQWRFDWAIFRGRTAGQGSSGNYSAHNAFAGVEYEGLFSEKSRHTTAAGFTEDTVKYNQAQACGWRVIRITAKNHKSIITELEKLL